MPTTTLPKALSLPLRPAPNPNHKFAMAGDGTDGTVEDEVKKTGQSALPPSSPSTLLFPGLKVTAAMLHRLLHALSLAVHIREFCVLNAPVAANTTLVAYTVDREIWDSGAGLIAYEARGGVSHPARFIVRVVEQGGKNRRGPWLFCLFYAMGCSRGEEEGRLQRRGRRPAGEMQQGK